MLHFKESQTKRIGKQWFRPKQNERRVNHVLTFMRWMKQNSTGMIILLHLCKQKFALRTCQLKQFHNLTVAHTITELWCVSLLIRGQISINVLMIIYTIQQFLICHRHKQYVQINKYMKYKYRNAYIFM